MSQTGNAKIEMGLRMLVFTGTTQISAVPCATCMHCGWVGGLTFCKLQGNVEQANARSRYQPMCWSRIELHWHTVPIGLLQVAAVTCRLANCSMHTMPTSRILLWKRRGCGKKEQFRTPLNLCGHRKKYKHGFERTAAAAAAATPSLHAGEGGWGEEGARAGWIGQVRHKVVQG